MLDLPTVYCFCAVIGVFAVLHQLQIVRESKRTGHLLPRLPGYKRLTSTSRGICGRQFRLAGWYSPTVATIALIGSLMLVTAGLTLGPKPYYWPKPYDYFAIGHTPPLATRAGWIALAIIPFMVLLATKWNLITVLTGASYERLQILHQWSAYVMFVLTLVHAFPNIIVNIRHGTMVSSWNNNPVWWTGVAATAVQTMLTVMSLPFIRNRWYETFKGVHYVLSIAFVVFLFLHCQNILTSWHYFYALASLYIFSWLVRWARTTWNGFNHIATIESLPGDILHVTIPTSTALKWKPGQHFLFRFFVGGLHGLSSAPFTVASIPYSENPEIELFIKVAGGITRRMASASASQALHTRVWLDGPYGGVEGKMEAYEHVLLLAGGSGGSFILPIFRHLLTVKQSAVKSIKLVFTTRSTSLLDVFRKAVDLAIAESKNQPVISFALRDTSHTFSSLASTPPTPSEAGEGKRMELPSTEEDKTQPPSTEVTGRPHLASVIDAQFLVAGTVAIAACGPQGFTFDVRNAVAPHQLAIARGRTDVTECFLHTEVFGW